MTFNINITEIAILLSILLRLSIILFMLPIFSAAGVPAVIKALIVLSFSVMLLPVVRQNVQPVPFDMVSLGSAAVGELIYGIVFSLCILIVSSAFHMAGELVGFDMGFGFAQTADPESGGRTNALSAWTQLLATVLFFSINGHHFILKILVESFKTVPIGSFALGAGLFSKIILLSGMLFVLAVKLAAPVLAVLVLAQVGFGLIAKFAPQMNVLATSFPITITIGMLFMGLAMTFWGQMGTESFMKIFHFLENLPK